MHYISIKICQRINENTAMPFLLTQRAYSEIMPLFYVHDIS